MNLPHSSGTFSFLLNLGAAMPSSYLVEVVDNLRGIQPDAARSTYADALRISVRVQLEYDGKHPAPPSPYNIHHDTGIKLDAQKRYRISLTKREAHAYLSSLGAPIPDRFDTFAKAFGEREYCDVFGKKKAPKIGNKQLIFTYAEWHHIVDHVFQIELPDELMDLNV